MKNEHETEGKMIGGDFLPNCCAECRELMTFPGGRAYCRQDENFPVKDGICKGKKK